MNTLIGKTISHYRIIEKIGEGGMGVVYKAHDTKLDRPVALKFLPATSVATEDARNRLTLEARAAAALDHPSICTIHEIDEIDDRMFISMAFIDGSTVERMVQSSPLPATEALDIAIHVAEGLKAAHARGVIHQDIKSSNIMVTQEGRVKITDFGLAKLEDAQGGDEDTSQSGTLYYMSPEQILGKAVDGGTDIWSLGVTLYEMITGHVPFTGEYEQAVAYAILNEEPEPIASTTAAIPPELIRCLEKMLVKDPDGRYRNVEELLEDLKAIRASVASGAGGEAFHRRMRGLRPLVAWVGGALLAIYLALTIVGHFSGGKREKGAEVIAVFPFENSRQDPDYEWLSEELARTLTFKLSQVPSLNVIDRLQIQKAIERMQIRQAGMDVGEVLNRAADLDASLGIVGSYTLYGDSIMVMASLVEMDSHFPTPLVEKIYPKDDLLTMQSDIAKRVISQVDSILEKETGQ